MPLVYTLTDPYGADRVALDEPEISSPPDGEMVITLGPSTSFTMYIMSPTVFVEGSGRDIVVSRVPVTDTMSSAAPTVNALDAGSTMDRTLVLSKARFPDPSVFRIEPGVGAALGHTNVPIVRDELELVTFDVITSSHKIPGMYRLSCCRIHKN